VGVLELASCANASIKISVTVLEGADSQVAVVYGNRLGRPPTVPTPVVRDLPFRLVQLVAVEFVVPDQLERPPVR
jgi:hypothetical protein